MTSATWTLTPTIDGPIAGTYDFHSVINWDFNVPDETASFGLTARTNISFSADDTTIGAWIFTAGDMDYTFTVGGVDDPGDQTLTFTGAGIAVNAGSVTINVSANLVDGSFGRLAFNNDSSAGAATILVGSLTSLTFSDTSSAGNSHISNSSNLVFNGSSGAGSATITSSSQTFVFNDDSSAENADITTNSALFFNDDSSAGQAEITNNASLFFSNDSTAEEATIITYGFTRLAGNSSGGEARFITQAGGDVSIANLASIGTTAGSIEGAGNYGLGGKILTVGSNGLDTEVSGVISGNGGSLVKVGASTLTLSGISTFSGGTTVEDGILFVTGSIASSGLTGVAEGAILGGNGTVGAVQVVGGTLAPGSSAGILKTGDLEFLVGATSELAIELGGTGAGTGYDQVAVSGGVTLGGATLDLTLLNGFAPVSGTSFTIIANDGSDAVGGTFAGLTQGATFNVGAVAFSISYSGGNGNDVVLTAIEVPPPAQGVTINGTNQDDTVNATQTVASQPLPTAFADLVNGLGGNDSLDALAGNDEINGGKGNDKVFGGLGADFLSGGAGKNKLTGGGDADRFVFDAKLGNGKDGTDNKSSFAKVADFEDGDLIHLSEAVFKKLDLGVLSDDALRDIGEKATKDTRIAFAGNGEVSYDKDGKGGADAIVFAKLAGKPDLDAGDFVVVA